MPTKKILILNNQQIQQKIDRIAYQILEDNFDEKELVIAGIISRGYLFAQRLKKVLEKISSLKVQLVKIELDKKSTTLRANSDTDVSKCKNKVIIVVDDVLNSGRTLAYGLGVFINIPTKKVRTAVLIDRSHKIFPISTDFVGHCIATTLKEHVSVVFGEGKQEDAVYLS